MRKRQSSGNGVVWFAIVLWAAIAVYVIVFLEDIMTTY